jgi:hypothetical protein
MPLIHWRGGPGIAARTLCSWLAGMGVWARSRPYLLEAKWQCECCHAEPETSGRAGLDWLCRRTRGARCWCRRRSGR